MPKLELTIGQVIELVKQLSQEDKSAIVQALSSETQKGSNTRWKQQEQQLRAFSVQRGLDWDSLSEDDREVLAQSLRH